MSGQSPHRTSNHCHARQADLHMSLDQHLLAVGQSPRPFRAAVWRGLGGLLPPFLTVLLIFGLLGMVRRYVLLPVESGLNWTLAQWFARSIVADDTSSEGPDELGPAQKDIHGQRYRRASDGRYVPERIFNTVRERELHQEYPPAESYTSWQLCQRYVEHAFL